MPAPACSCSQSGAAAAARAASSVGGGTANCGMCNGCGPEPKSSARHPNPPTFSSTARSSPAVGRGLASAAAAAAAAAPPRRLGSAGSPAAQVVGYRQCTGPGASKPMASVQRPLHAAAISAAAVPTARLLLHRHAAAAAALGRPRLIAAARSCRKRARAEGEDGHSQACRLRSCTRSGEAGQAATPERPRRRPVSCCCCCSCASSSSASGA